MENKRNHLLCEVCVDMNGAFGAGNSAWEEPPQQLYTLHWPAKNACVSTLRKAGNRLRVELL
jgi:hypothetical protein